MKQISPCIDPVKMTIEFSLQSDCKNHVSIEGIHQVSLVGSFNHWSQDVLLLRPDEDGVWKIKIPMLPKGKYQYKFLLDDKIWLEDFANENREPDGFNGFNSILTV
jgi:1,4-alpha-glucan branching enzyme